VRVQLPPDPVLTAVLCSLAGVRQGDAVAAVGAGPRLAAALCAAAGSEHLVEHDAAVVVAARAHDVPVALSRLAVGGRIVALAADAAAAHRVAAAAGLTTPHVERLGAVVAWSARRPLAT
jgi:protein-L-isoaspartate O-methyltransferase